jgi:hypothetical protein
LSKEDVNLRAEFSGASRRTFAAGTIGHALGEEAFHRLISIERRRTKRSRKSFLLMLLDMGEHSNSRLGMREVLSTLTGVLRETDVTGWYKEGSVVGILFTEITLDDEGSTAATLMRRVSQALKSRLSPQQFHQIGISFHLIPEVETHADVSTVSD